MRRVISSAFAALCLSVIGCAPLTFSEPAAIDFEAYRSVFVSVNPDGLAQEATLHFAEELRVVSGFERVTTDASEAVDLRLLVEVTVTVEEDDDGDISYHGVGEYAARTPSGSLVDSGSEDDDSITGDEVTEDVLDEIALHYIAPFRL